MAHVEPIGLVTVRDQGYLLARRGTEDRTYRLSRVLAAEELDEPARRSETVDLDRAWRERNVRFRTGGDNTAVAVCVDPAHREHLVATALAVASEETTEDGRLRLHVVFQDARHAEWALWQHAPYAEVEARSGCAVPCTNGGGGRGPLRAIGLNVASAPPRPPRPSMRPSARPPVRRHAVCRPKNVNGRAARSRRARNGVLGGKEPPRRGNRWTSERPTATRA